MPRASPSSKLFGFLVILGFFSISNSRLQPSFHLQVFQKENSYTSFLFLFYCSLSSLSCKKQKVLIFLMHTSCTLFFGSCPKTDDS